MVLARASEAFRVACPLRAFLVPAAGLRVGRSPLGPNEELTVPYMSCPDCGARTYSAATWSNVDHCPRCGRDLPPRSRTALTGAGPPQQLRRAAQLESATTALRRLRERSG
jgi:predicted RNA-binding Zn-ribbon protein involved in translation (DUF1610 family)